jgi:hypothetical protein
MICANCKTERKDTDFLNSHKFCYQCMYQEKLKNVVEKRNPNAKSCRSCGKFFSDKENLKKRQRTIFCSKECAEIGHRKQIHEHWTRKLRKEDSWRTGAKFKWKIDQR